MEVGLNSAVVIKDNRNYYGNKTNYTGIPGQGA